MEQIKAFYNMMARYVRIAALAFAHFDKVIAQWVLFIGAIKTA